MTILRMIWVGVRGVGRAFGVAGRATVALVGICGVIAALANYTMTQGAGTTFGSIVVSTVHYAQMMICDMAAPATQCAAVDGSGNVSVKDAAVLAAVQASVPAGTNLIGKVGIDQTTPGTTNVVQVNAALPAGTNLMGKVGIDQTTPGTTNGVQDAATSATGAAPPSKANYQGANASGATGGNMKGLIQCDNYVFKHITSATDTLAVQGVASQTIYICGFHARAAGTATWFLENTASANANCSSANTQISVLNSEVVNTGIVDHTPFWSGLKNTSGNGLCINSTGTGGVDVGVYYAQF